MAEPPDRVQVIKQESAALGGDAADELPFDAPIEPQEDAIEAAGLYLQDGSNRDETTLTWREALDMKFKDGNNPSGASLTDLLSGTDDKTAKVSTGDTTPDFLEEKLVEGTNIVITKQNVGGDETLEIAAPTAAVPPATCCGQILLSVDGTTFSPQLPLASRQGCWMMNRSGRLLIKGPAS